MRFELAGSMVHLPPVVITYDVENVSPFNPTYYANLGYIYFEVICIGGGGGSGGGINTENTGTLIRSYGGSGGGGGIHRVKGLLSALPASTPVVVGEGGDSGADHISDGGATVNGTDGGASSFNGTTCVASGGKGGISAKSNSETISTSANGGDGGIGNRSLAGGGAAGGTAGTPENPGPGVAGTDGADGTWDGVIGSGGGGGAGGVGLYGSGGTTLNQATKGGRGAYSAVDRTVYALGGDPTDDISTGSQLIVPGRAGGAKAAPLTGLPYEYGGSVGIPVSADSGLVVVRVTVD